MTTPGSNGADPRALVRPYTVTRGRTATASAWPPETVVAAVDAAAPVGPAVADEELRQLAGRVRGSVWLAGDPGFDDEVAAGATASPDQRPRVVVGARDVDDVAAAVTFAAERGLSVAVAATGYAGRTPAGDGVLVSVRRLRELTVDATHHLVRVGAGVVWSEVVAVAARHGLAPPCGAAGTTGVVEHTLRGGLGPMARALGFAADHVVAVEVVTADGVARRVDAEHHTELFWGLRGGLHGANVLGVVTALELGLVELPSLAGGGLAFDAAAAPAVLAAYPEWSATLGDETTTALSLRRTGSTDVPAVRLRVAHVGPPADADIALAEMRAHEPRHDTVAAMSAGAVDSLGHDSLGHDSLGHDSLGHDALGPDPDGPAGGTSGGTGAAWTRGLLMRELHPDAMDVLLEVTGSEADAPAGVEIHHLGGATRMRPAPDDAIGGRDARYGIVLVDVLDPDGAPPARGIRLLERLAPYAAGTATVTVSGTPAGTEIDVAADPDSPTRARLAELADRLDPDGRFRPAEPGTTPLDGGRHRRDDTTPGGPEARAIVELARPWRSVAEIASELGLPLGVVRVLLADLDEAGLVTVHEPPAPDDTDHLERVLRGLRQRL